MGACATKPKVLKDATQAPVLAPEQDASKEEESHVAAEVAGKEIDEREVIAAVEGEKATTEEEEAGNGGADDEDDQRSRKHSLGSLLLEGEEVKDLNVDGDIDVPGIMSETEASAESTGPVEEKGVLTEQSSNAEEFADAIAEAIKPDEDSQINVVQEEKLQVETSNKETHDDDRVAELPSSAAENKKIAEAVPTE